MNAIQTSLYVFLRSLLSRTEGQDLVEYSLVFSLIALGCVTGMGSIATSVDTVFSTTATVLTTSTS